jgi:hypothetical protein
VKARALCIVTLVFVTLTPSLFTNSASARRTAVDCYAYAWTPDVAVVSGHPKGRAQGGTWDANCEGYWQGTLKMLNNAGNVLAPYPVPIQGTGFAFSYVGPWGACAGAILRSNNYINDSGQGSSDTSGTNSDCAY